MRTWIALVAGCVAGLFSMAQGAGAVSLQSIGNFNEPIYMTSPPGDPRLFVVERGGRIQVVHDGTTSQFLDIHDLTTENGERGLLSMAFDPNYAKNGLFYVFYTGTAAADGQEGLGHVDEFRVSANTNVANRASQRHVLTITRPSPGPSNHNGGQLQFGRDGYLYITVGDGGTGGSTAPNLGLLNGKILRIDPHGSGPGGYSIPPGNPYASSSTARHEIWASGFRNPWRFSFDRATGDLVIADVGEGRWEEIDLARAASGLGRGANFGWPGCEGFAGTCPGTIPPVFVYPHGDPGGDVAHGCAIIGGYVYRGTQIPELAGRYLYADLCTGELRSVQLGIPFAGGDRPESAPGALTGPQSFGEDASCNLYVTNGNAVDRIVGSATGASICSPIINFVRPAEDATEVQQDALVVVAFDKAMDKPSARTAFSLKRTSDGAPVSGSFGWYGPGVLLFKPDTDLAAGTQYTASVSTAAKDLAGKPLASAKTWRFATTTPPSVQSVSPADGATGVSPSSLTYAVFNKAMRKAATRAAFSLKRTSDGAPVSGSFGWVRRRVLLFKPTADLAPGTQYTASVSTAAKDLAGKPLTHPVTWSYATGPSG
jgi:glucose/arabinose dehydrogenase